MSVHRRFLKTPLGIIEYIWLDGGLVPYEVLRQEWHELSRTPEPPSFDTNSVRNYPKTGEVTPKTLIASCS